MVLFMFLSNKEYNSCQHQICFI